MIKASSNTKCLTYFFAISLSIAMDFSGKWNVSTTLSGQTTQCISLVNFAKRHSHPVRDVGLNFSTNIWAFTFIGTCNKSFIMCANQRFAPNRIPIVRNGRHNNTSNWAAVQPHARQGYMDVSLSWICQLDLYCHGWFITTCVQWQAPCKISGGQMKVWFSTAFTVTFNIVSCRRLCCRRVFFKWNMKKNRYSEWKFKRLFELQVVTYSYIYIYI